MHDIRGTTPYRGLRKVADNILQVDDLKPTPLVAVAEKSAREAELCILRLHCFV